MFRAGVKPHSHLTQAEVKAWFFSILTEQPQGLWSVSSLMPLFPFKIVSPSPVNRLAPAHTGQRPPRRTSELSIKWRGGVNTEGFWGISLLITHSLGSSCCFCRCQHVT